MILLEEKVSLQAEVYVKFLFSKLYDFAWRKSKFTGWGLRKKVRISAKFILNITKCCFNLILYKVKESA